MKKAKPKTLVEELDPRIIESKSQMAPIEELETFLVDPSKVLQVKKELDKDARRN